jgi:hypothetical protein
MGTLIWSKVGVSSSSPEEPSIAHPGQRESFVVIEAKAREILRERGFDDHQIDAELNRRRREERLD